MTKTFPVENPATLDVLAQVPDLGPTDAAAAVDRAADAYRPWSATSPRHRSDVLRKAYDLMLRDQAELARTISLENGKSLADATGEVAYAAEFFSASRSPRS